MKRKKQLNEYELHTRKMMIMPNKNKLLTNNLLVNSNVSNSYIKIYSVKNL